MVCLVSRCILLLLLICVTSLVEGWESEACAEGDDDESCRNDESPQEIMDIDIDPLDQTLVDDLDPLEAIQKYGVEQTVDGHESVDTLNNIRRSLSYMGTLENTDDCRNKHELCSFWASIGECEKNPFMLTHCGPSCQSCTTENIIDTNAKNIDLHVENSSDDKPLPELSEIEALDAVKEYGEPQKLDGSQESRLLSLNVIRESIVYMRSLGNSLKQEIIDECKNKHELCAFWVSIGECEANVAYMKVDCGPSCRSCEILDYDHRCPPRDPDLLPGLRPFDLDKRLQQIVDNPDLKVTVHSRPDLDEGTDAGQPPWVISIDDFLTSEECDKLVELGHEQGYERSKDVGPKKLDGSFEPIENKGRTSTNAWCSKDCEKDPVASSIHNRISNLVQIPQENFENFQILRYEEGQFYNQHHDFIDHQVDRACGPRVLTFYQYLSDVEEGGGTGFPLLDIEVEPKKGRALLWPSVLSSNPKRQDDRMDHEALPVIKGLKYGANAWIHLYDFKTPHDKNCA